MSPDPSLSVITPEKKVLEDLWSQALAQLKLQMAASTYSVHFPDTHLLPSGNGTWCLEVKSQYQAEWIANRLSPLITKTLARITGEEKQLEVTIK